MGNFHKGPNLYIGVVNIRVKNLSNSIIFYKDVIGLKVMEQTDKKAVLTADGKRPLLILEQPDNADSKQGRTTGLYHFAILLPSRADLGNFLRHIAEINYPLGAGDHLVSEALYLNDIDGNGIEVYSDRPSSLWKWNGSLVEMATDQVDFQGLLAESSEPWAGLPDGTIMGHIHLHVSDLKKAEEFYTKGLGFDIVSYYPQALFLSTGGYHHHIAVNTWAGVGAPPAPKNSPGLNWYEIVFPNGEMLMKTVENLKQIGVDVQKTADYYVTRDPSENEIRLVLENS